MAHRLLQVSFMATIVRYSSSGLLVVLGAVCVALHACAQGPGIDPSAVEPSGAAGTAGAPAAHIGGPDSGFGGFPNGTGGSTSDASAGAAGVAVDAAGAGGVANATAPSCQLDTPGAGANCGSANDDDCCASLLVSGGNFHRSYDGVWYQDQTAPATVSSFRLDKYAITVGRFRQFVEAVIAGYEPPPGSGKHTYLNSGNGLAQAGNASNTFETGWDPSWQTLAPLPKLASQWDTELSCNGEPRHSWTAAAGNNEKLPINCINWYRAYAFCIWDGGFLASEAEWNYAAAGGAEQRVFPWSSPPTATTIDCSYANYKGLAFDGGFDFCVAAGSGALSVVGSRPKGAGRFGQLDIVGNVAAWALDWAAVSYASPCSDGVQLMPGSVVKRVVRGGSYVNGAAAQTASVRWAVAPNEASVYWGARCARPPA